MSSRNDPLDNLADGAVGRATVVVDPAGEVTVRTAGVADAVTGRPLTDATPLHLCSMAKTLAAVVVLRLSGRGVLDLDADVRNLVAVDVSVPGLAGPSLRQLLAHRGGVVDPDGAFEPSPTPAPATADVVAGRTSAHPGPITVTTAPGGTFSYSDAGYCLVEAAVEAATSEPFAAVLHQEVAAPLGLTSTAVWGGAPGDPATPHGAAIERIAASAAAGHRPDGSRVPGERLHYAGLAASSLWSTPAEVGVLLADLVRCWSGSDGGVLLDPDQVAAMTADTEGTGVGCGVFLLGSAERPCVMTQGWGDGFQGQLRGYPSARGGLAVLVNQNPGVPQHESVVGRSIAALAAERQWAAV